MNDLLVGKKPSLRTDNGFDVRNDRVAKRVYFTRDLSRFKLIKGNRPVNQSQVALLAKGMEMYGVLCSPIIVNENGEIYDGQHRFSAAKLAGLGIYYVIANGYTLEQIQILNLTQKNWTVKDFHCSFVAAGLDEYVKLDKFWKRFSDLSLSTCIAICSNVIASSNVTAMTKEFRLDSSAKQGSFKKGTFVCTNMSVANDWAMKIMLLKPYFAGYKNTGFVQAMIYMFKHPNFNFQRFIRILQRGKVELKTCSTRKQYKEMIEHVYNHYQSKKVNLRFMP